MATPLDIKVIPKLQKIIKKYGVQAIFYIPVHLIGGPDYTTGDPQVSTPEAQSLVKVSPPGPWEMSMLSNTVVIDSKISTILPNWEPVTITPFLHQQLLIAGQRYTIVQIEPLVSGDKIAAWALGLQ